MPPSTSSDSGKPSPEARRFLDETTGSEKPRVFRNAVLLLTPSKDGLSAAEARVRDYLAWDRVMGDVPGWDGEFVNTIWVGDERAGLFCEWPSPRGHPNSMTTYRWMQAPGIDMLGFQFTYRERTLRHGHMTNAELLLTCREADSVACQLGRRRVSSVSPSIDSIIRSGTCSPRVNG